MRLLIMGPQGVGKGTQAALLSEHYGIPAISTGDIFRYNIKNKTELGVEALKYIDKGHTYRPCESYHYFFHILG